MAEDVVHKDWIPTALVIGPAGAKAFLEIGILKSLDISGLLSKITKIAGVSVGAVIGLLLTCGVPIDKIYDKAQKFNIFHDLFNIKLEDIKEKAGILSGDTLRKELSREIESIYGFIPTLSQLYKITGIELVMVATNLVMGGPEYISYKTHPDTSCIDPVIWSSTIPFIFQMANVGDVVYIDGAFSDPYPINIFDNDNTLGIYVYTIFPSVKQSLLSYIFLSLTVSINQLRKKNITRSGNRCKNIKSGYSRKADLLYASSEEKEEMFRIGYKSGEEFLENLRTGNSSICLGDIEGQIDFLEDE